MKLEFDHDTTHTAIRAYDIGYIETAGEILRRSCILTPDLIIRDWPPQNFSELSTTDFATIVDLDPRIVLLGSGKILRFPDPVLTQALMDRHIGFEVMDTAAACRVYNILLAEGRKIAAALLMIEP